MAIVRGILKESIRNLGPAGSVVDIKRGYFRFLHQSHKVVYATSEALKEVEAQRAELQRQDLLRKEKAEKLVGTLKNYTLTMALEASEKGMLYGSVTPRDIAKNLEDVAPELSMHHVFLSAPIKEIGKYSVRIETYPGVATAISLVITNLHGHSTEDHGQEIGQKEEKDKKYYTDDRYEDDTQWDHDVE